MNLLQELNADGTVKEEHTNAKVPIPGIGQLVETYRPSEVVQKIYPIMDMRGTITKWVQSNGTTVLASREYEAFGNIIPNSASGTWPGRFGYQGQTWIEIVSADGTQRLLLSPIRIYDPSIARFLQSDPLNRYLMPMPFYARERYLDRIVGRWLQRQPTGYKDGVSLYQYARSNPTSFFDPTGLYCCCKTIKITDSPNSAIGGQAMGRNIQGSEFSYGFTVRVDARVGNGDDITKCEISQQLQRVTESHDKDGKKSWNYTNKDQRKRETNDPTSGRFVTDQWLNGIDSYGDDILNKDLFEPTPSWSKHGIDWVEWSDAIGWSKANASSHDSFKYRYVITRAKVKVTCKGTDGNSMTVKFSFVIAAKSDGTGWKEESSESKLPKFPLDSDTLGPPRVPGIPGF